MNIIFTFKCHYRFTCEIENTQNPPEVNALTNQDLPIFEEPRLNEESSTLTRSITKQQDAISIQEQQHQINVNK